MAGWLTELEAHCARRRAEDAAEYTPPLIVSAEPHFTAMSTIDRALAMDEKDARIAALEAELADLRQTYLALEAEVADLRKAADAEARAGDEARAENAKLRACLTEITHHSVCCDARYMAAEALK